MSKNNLVLGGILAVLVAMAFIWSGPFQEWRSNLGKPANFLSGLNADEISRVEIDNDDRSVDLEKIGEKWRVASTKDFYLKDSVSGTIISSLKDAVGSELELVGENPDNKKEFKTDASGATVRLYRGNELLTEFIVGKASSDFISTYISKSDLNETYLVEAGLNSAFDRTDWYDPAIFNFEPDSINKLRFQYPTREFTVEKDESGNWRGVLPYSFQVSKEKIDEIVGAISKMNAVKIPEQTFAGTGLDKNLIIVQASANDSEHTIMIGDRAISGSNEPGEEDGDGSPYYAKRSDSDNIYLISADMKEKLDLTIKELK